MGAWCVGCGDAHCGGWVAWSEWCSWFECVGGGRWWVRGDLSNGGRALPLCGGPRTLQGSAPRCWMATECRTPTLTPLLHGFACFCVRDWHLGMLALWVGGLLVVLGVGSFQPFRWGWVGVVVDNPLLLLLLLLWPFIASCPPSLLPIPPSTPPRYSCMHAHHRYLLFAGSCLRTHVGHSVGCMTLCMLVCVCLSLLLPGH
jgi:hypothetical protein